MTVTFPLFTQFLIPPVKFERYIFKRIHTPIKFIDYTQKNHFHTPNVTQFYVYISHLIKMEVKKKKKRRTFPLPQHKHKHIADDNSDII